MHGCASGFGQRLALDLAKGVGCLSKQHHLPHPNTLGSEVYLYNEFAALTVEGQRSIKIRIYDDGTHGDARAGDFTYGRSGVG